MKRALIWAGFVVVGAVAGVTGYYWTQATYLPRWYGQSGATLSGETATASDLLNTQAATAQPATEGQIVLNEAELNRVVVDAIANAPQAEKLLASLPKRSPLQVAQHILRVGANDQPVFGDVDGVEVPLDALNAVVLMKMVDGGLGIFAGADEIQAQPSTPGRR
jgi:hypothetical protein